MHNASKAISLAAWRYLILTLCALPLTLDACVIPVGPQFDDPEENFPPFVVSSDPGVGNIFTPVKAAAPDGGAEPIGARFITVTLGDHNLGDPLFLRWLFDYPGTDLEGGQLVMVAELPPSGKTDRSPARFAPTCSRGAGMHRLVLSVSDREFLDTGNGDSVSPDAPLDSFRPGANRHRAVWMLLCP
jgi:hypothetical protein